MSAVDRGTGRLRRVVAVGGGHGLSRTLQACRRIADHTTAIVTAADDGGSSGRLRRDLDVVPPGDLRMALAALSPDGRLAELLQYRFDRGELAGHSLGNLALVALQGMNDGDLVAALDELAGLLGIPGRVLPCTTTPVTLHGEGRQGRVDGQVSIARTVGLERVWLRPADPPVTAASVAAIADAELIVLGPGSLYTSILPNLLVPGIAAAIAASPAPRVFIANLREQRGETQGLELTDHLDALAAHVPDVPVDVLVAHRPDPARPDRPEPGGTGRWLQADERQLASRVAEVVTADLAGVEGHDADALAQVLAPLADRRRATR